MVSQQAAESTVTIIIYESKIWNESKHMKRFV